MTRRTPSGAAVLQPAITAAIADAVTDELVEKGLARLSMEGVAARAGVGKSALYRRWPSKERMVLAVLADLVVPLAEVPDTGALYTDVRATVEAVTAWITHPKFGPILLDLAAEGTRNPALAAAVTEAIGGPRRERAFATLRRAIDRGELPADLDLELAADFLAAPMAWRIVVRRAPTGPSYLDDVTEMIVRAIGGTAP
ncbi:TetR/AcrR family transcriptional regulator [Fodinicola acaciae]|uniref:TetR/AcrR family transcriptional regulator n=1 Tax=Fodinicola acaciae TaxID=2681555 RepID=UPI0013D63664|nr:TetR/AcrR family transcriptional regulator [Fodinicola acaciae]